MKSFELNKDWSNWIKLLAAVLVAVSHYSNVVIINKHWSDSSFAMVPRWLPRCGSLLLFGGYGWTESETKKHLSVTDFFRKSFLKVYLPVLLVSAIWVPLY